MTYRTLVYLTGPPAAGKSTAMAALTAGCDRFSRPRPVPHDVLYDRRADAYVGAELGVRRDRFSGTDALSMSVAPAARAWLADPACPGLLLGEGDRLAIMSFLSAAAAAGYRVCLVQLTAPGGVLDGRCAARGSAQNPTWRKGRATKASRLFEAFAVRVGHTPGFASANLLDTGARPPADVAAAIRSCVPALAALPWPVNREQEA
jgi:hypothetical protein